MGVVIRWPQHIRKQCSCEGTNVYCNGCVLFTCSTCGGSEAELTTDCCGQRLAYNIRQQVQFGQLDYRRRMGGWISRGKNFDWVKVDDLPG